MNIYKKYIFTFTHCFVFFLSAINIKYFNVRNAQFQRYFTNEDQLSYCTNVNALFELLGCPHDPKKYRLFIDSSKSGFKVVLLHNGNKQPSVPLAYSTKLKETRETMELILNKLNYSQYKWKICSDLKVVGLLIGLKRGNPSYPCFKCLWDHSKRGKDKHYTDFEWPKRPEEPTKDEYSMEYDNYLVNPDSFIIPALHLELGAGTQLIATLAKSIDKGGEEVNRAALSRLYEIFAYKTKAKIDGGIFNGPELRKLLADDAFENLLNAKFQRALRALRCLVHNFFGNRKHPNYKQMVQEFITSYHEIGANMTVKLHFLHNHLDEFPDNLGHFSEQHGERFHKDIRTMETRYSGKDYSAMLSDYCWFLLRENENYDRIWDRKSKTMYFNKNE